MDEINQSKWGYGMPEYTPDDVMTEQDLLNFAMNIVKQYEIDKNGYEIVDATDRTDQIPNFVLKKDGRLWFVVVKCAIYPDDAHLGVEQRNHMMEHAAKFNAAAYFAPVSIMPMDLIRANASLALKNDGYYIKYNGLEKIAPKATTEWIARALAELDQMEQPEIQSTGIKYSDRTSYMDDDIRYGRHANKNEFEAWEKKAKELTFQEMLLKCIDTAQLTPQAFYTAACMDRKLFSAIKNNPDYKPKKETAVACCFGLKLNLADAEKLIELAGYKLSLSIKWDRVVYYCLKKGITDIELANELLYELDEKCIRA